MPANLPKLKMSSGRRKKGEQLARKREKVARKIKMMVKVKTMITKKRSYSTQMMIKMHNRKN